MAWIELHDNIWEHHKTVKFCAELGINEVQAVGHLVSLWQFAMRNAPDTGDLGAWDDCGIAKAARCPKESNSEQFCNALRNAKLLDGHKIHDWDEFTLHFKASLERRERKREQVRERVKNYRQKKSNASSNAPVTLSNAATLPNLTLPNLTVPIQTKKINPKNQIPPTAEMVRDYCLERNNSIDAEQFIAHYAANGWMRGKSKVKDWQACILTWEKRNGTTATSTPRTEWDIEREKMLKRQNDSTPSAEF